MLRNRIRTILREIFDLNPEQKQELKKKYRLSFRHKSKGTEKDKYNQVLKYTFMSKKYKYVVDVEEYDLDFYVISFYPKLNLDFDIKQAKLRDLGRPYHTKYSYQTKEYKIGKKEYDIRITIEILNLLITLMDDLFKENPKASFGFFGAPNVYTSNEEENFFNTKRIRIYNEMLRRNFSNTHDVLTIERFSGGFLVNKDMLETNPELIEYGQTVLQSHV